MLVTKCQNYEWAALTTCMLKFNNTPLVLSKLLGSYRPNSATECFMIYSYWVVVIQLNFLSSLTAMEQAGEEQNRQWTWNSVGGRLVTIREVTVSRENLLCGCLCRLPRVKFRGSYHSPLWLRLCDSLSSLQEKSLPVFPVVFVVCCMESGRNVSILRMYFVSLSACLCVCVTHNRSSYLYKWIRWLPMTPKTTYMTESTTNRTEPVGLGTKTTWWGLGKDQSLIWKWAC